MSRIVFAGDVFLGSLPLPAGTRQLINAPDFVNADARVVNLEHPLCDSGELLDKSALFAPPEMAEVLRREGVSFVTLANNHVHGRGTQGIATTLEVLGTSGISCAGAGLTIEAAAAPVQLTDGLALLGYCRFGRRYLSNVWVADGQRPGVAPLIKEQIESDLSKLPADVTAVLFLHWGREHVWLPPREDIDLARSLLRNRRVALIIGCHSHRVQGVVSEAGKQAYISLGNFFFPDFYIDAPNRLTRPVRIPDGVPKTRIYHSVSRLTRKEWPLINRVGLLATYDESSRLTQIQFSFQKSTGDVVQLGAAGTVLATCWVRILSAVYRLPKPAYATLAAVDGGCSALTWNTRLLAFRIKQNGLKATATSAGRLLRSRVRNRGPDG